MDSIRKYFYEHIVDRVIDDVFPPHQLIDGGALEALRNVFASKGIPMPDDMGDTQFPVPLDYSMEDEDESDLFEHALRGVTPRHNTIYIQWFFSIDTPAPIAKFSLRDAIDEASSLWYSGPDDIVIFDDSCEWFVFIDHDGGTIRISLEIYRAMYAMHWKDRAAGALDGEFSPDNLERMRRRDPPLHPERKTRMHMYLETPSYEDRLQTPDDLTEYWPWDFAPDDPYLH